MTSLMGSAARALAGIPMPTQTDRHIANGRAEKERELFRAGYERGQGEGQPNEGLRTGREGS